MDVLENMWDDDFEVEDSEDDWIMEYIFLDDKPKLNERNEHETSISVNSCDLKGKSHFDHARLRSKMQKSNNNSLKIWPINSVSLENCIQQTNLLQESEKQNRKTNQPLEQSIVKRMTENSRFSHNNLNGRQGPTSKSGDYELYNTNTLSTTQLRGIPKKFKSNVNWSNDCRSNTVAPDADRSLCRYISPMKDCKQKSKTRGLTIFPRITQPGKRPSPHSKLNTRATSRPFIAQCLNRLETIKDDCDTISSISTAAYHSNDPFPSTSTKKHGQTNVLKQNFN